MKSIKFFLLPFILIVGISTSSLSQNNILDSLNISISDTTVVKTKKKHSPTKATLMSTAVPGLGQVYNKKYWKLPLIYAGIGTSMYFGISNNKSFKKFKTAYGLRIDGDPNTIDEFDDVLSESGIKANMDYHQRNRDLSYIIAGVLYVLNIVDAAVDAHLFDFPKNDNLSLNLQPSIELTANNQFSKGFKLVINL